MTENEMKTTTVQLPRELLKELKKVAKLEGRSVGSQVRIFLADALTRINKVNTTDQ